jgi:hypothetical protein
MRSSWRLVGGLVVVSAVAIGVACGGGHDGGSGIPDAGTGSGNGSGGGPDSGSPDSGAPDAGPSDAGPPDAGPPDAGPPDAGGLKTISFPQTANWDFYGPQNGGPQDVRDVAMDEGGNLWVAGGSEGLFLMRVSASGKLTGTFEKFGIADGLHPYGWLNGEAAKGMGVVDGTPADPHPSLDATPLISVAGGPAGTVFVGYQGKPGCESAWNGNEWTAPSLWGDPSIYKSGDADRVTLNGTGISVVHYDIFSGPGQIRLEIKGREKLCSIYRLAWDKTTNQIWFGGNHGFAVGKADAANAPTCNGQPGCPVSEHSHPAIAGCKVDYDYATGHCPSDLTGWLTDAYYGVAVDPGTHDVWMGGSNRTTLFQSATLGGFYNAADNGGELPLGPPGMSHRWDLWPDQIGEWDPSRSGDDRIVYVMPLQRSTLGKSKPDYALDDVVSGIVALGDGTAWVASFAHGLIHVDSSGNRLADATASLTAPFVSTLALDPRDGSLWTGMYWGLGVSRLTSSGGKLATYGTETFGDLLYAAPSFVHGGNGTTRMMIGFRANAGYAGAIAIYKGP